MGVQRGDMGWPGCKHSITPSFRDYWPALNKILVRFYLVFQLMAYYSNTASQNCQQALFAKGGYRGSNGCQLKASE